MGNGLIFPYFSMSAKGGRRRLGQATRWLSWFKLSRQRFLGKSGSLNDRDSDDGGSTEPEV